MPKATSGGTFERALPQPGLHQAVCVDVIDMGMQTSEYMGEVHERRKVRVLFELDEVFPVEDIEGNFIISNWYTLSLHEKSNLSKDLESWFSKKFTAEQRRDGFEVENLIGHSATVNIVFAEKGDTTYANIGTILPPSAEPFTGTGTYQRKVKEAAKPPVPSHPAPKPNGVTDPIFEEEEEVAGPTRSYVMPDDDGTDPLLPF